MWVGFYFRVELKSNPVSDIGLKYPIRGILKIVVKTDLIHNCHIAFDDNRFTG